MTAKAQHAAHTFHTLDGLRGVAALCVVVFHLELPFDPLPRAYLAVDCFYLLSGFVIAHAYDARLASGLSRARFLLLRAVRLCPMLVVASALSVLTELAGARQDSELPIAHVLVKAIAQILAMPVPMSSDHEVFDLNPPLWSLNHEFLICGVFALLWSPKRGWFHMLVAVGAVTLVGAVLVAGSADVGVSYPRPWLGAPRVVFAFFAGFLLRRAWHGRTQPSWLAAGLCLGLACLFGVPVSMRVTPWADLIICLMVFPALVWGAAHWELPRRLVGISAIMSACSYAVYVVHYPLLRLLLFAFGLEEPGQLDSVTSLAFVVGVFAVAYACQRWFDEPVRAWLRARLPSTPPMRVVPS